MLNILIFRNQPGLLLLLHTQGKGISNCFRESALNITFDFFSNFIIEYCNSLKSKQNFELFDSIFNKKLKLINEKYMKFDKKFFRLFHEKYNKKTVELIEGIFTNSILGIEKNKQKQNQKIFNNHVADGRNSVNNNC